MGRRNGKRGREDGEERREGLRTRRKIVSDERGNETGKDRNIYSERR